MIWKLHWNLEYFTKNHKNQKFWPSIDQLVHQRLIAIISYRQACELHISNFNFDDNGFWRVEVARGSSDEDKNDRDYFQMQAMQPANITLEKNNQTDGISLLCTADGGAPQAHK